MPEETRTTSRHARGLAAAVLGFYAAVFLLSFHEADEDVWGRLAVGRLIAETGNVPTEDVFAYVPTKTPWVDHEWLSGVVFQGVYQRLGGFGLILLRAGLGLAAVALAWLLGRRSGGSAFAVTVLSLAVLPLWLQGANGVVRAQVFSFALFGLFWLFLDRGGRRLWLLVPATALWANLHGGVAAGLLLLIVYALFAGGRARVRLTALAGASTLATLANPYGVHYGRYLTGALSMPRPEIVEWRSVSFSSLDDLHLQLAAVLVVVLVWFGRAPRREPLVVLAGTFGASLLHVRFAPFLALAIVATLAPALEALFRKGAAAFPGRPARSAGPVLATVVLMALFGVGLAVAWHERDLELQMQVPPDRYPKGAVRWLEASGASGKLAVFFNWGEYALYHLYPRIRVSIDGRYETVYDEPVVRANWDFTRGVPGGERLLRLYPPDFALYPRKGGAARFLDRSPDWTLRLEDALFVLYQKRPRGR